MLNASRAAGAATAADATSSCGSAERALADDAAPASAKAIWVAPGRAEVGILAPMTSAAIAQIVSVRFTNLVSGLRVPRMGTAS
jgi:hypothetical protein